MTSAAAPRALAIDVFRGLTILVMIFVNDVASVRELPQWMMHMPPGRSGMTFVDVVFPAFLFIVGMAIPLAIDRRLDEGQPPIRLLGHVARRALALVWIGLVIMN